MTKAILLFFVTVLSSSLCLAQNINKEVIGDNGSPNLLGVINKDGLTKPAYVDWFNKNHKEYDTNKGVLKKLKDSLDQYTIKAFLGTWCGDSRREVPRFYNILESVNFPENQLEVFALDRTPEAYKKGPNGEEKGMSIHRVPTFIFYKNGEEVNRIVERPAATLERDMLAITTTNRYKPNYVGVNFIQSALYTKPVDSLMAKEETIVPWLADNLRGRRELNTLGYVYLRGKEFEKAMYVFKLNAKLFPYNAGVYDSLGEAYYAREKYSEALKYYYKVLSLTPEDENAKEMIAEISPYIAMEKAEHSH